MISKGLGATLTEDGFLLAERNMRFGKIIIATDSDPDGSHISSLLMTFFYEYYPNIIKKGMLYSLAPKLFKITHNGKDVYFGNEAELQAYLKANKLKKLKENKDQNLDLLELHLLVIQMQGRVQF